MPKANLKETDKLADAKRQGQAQFDSIKEMVEALEGWEGTAKAHGWTPYHDKFNVLCWKTEDGATWAGTAESLCREFGLDLDSDAQDEARQAIEEDALSVEVRSGWYSPGACSSTNDTNPAEYTILLCTGGPACRIIGELSEHGEPETAHLEVQDWFQPWTEMRPEVGFCGEGKARYQTYDSEPTLLAYARCFYFGEG